MKNQILCGDNLEILTRMETGSVQLVYADPPFNTRASWQAGRGGYNDKWVDDEYPAGWEWIALAFPAKSWAYAAFMIPRLLEMKRILADCGHFFLHCDWREAGTLRVLCDHIFGFANFKNEIIWKYPKAFTNDGSAGALKISLFTVAHNSIFWYRVSARSDDKFMPQYGPYTAKQVREIFHHRTTDGRRFRTRPTRGRTRIFADEAPGIPLTDVWDLPVAKPLERSGYPTQKPLSLLARIIKCGSEEGDLVLDPFCGSGTTLLAAKNEGRDYIGIDNNPEAVAVSRRRLDLGDKTD